MPRATTIAMLALAACATAVVVVMFRADAVDAPPLRQAEARAAARAIDAMPESGPGSAMAVSRAATTREATTREALDAPATRPIGRERKIRFVAVSFMSAVDGAVLSRGIDLNVTRATPPDPADPFRQVTFTFVGATTISAQPGRCTLEASIKGTAVGSQALEVEGVVDPIRVTMSVRAVGPFDGTVLDPLGQPMPNAPVNFRVVNAHGESSEAMGYVVSDTAGKFSIPALPWEPGCSMSLAPQHPDFARGDDFMIVTVDQRIEKRPSLRVGTRLTEVVGRVVDSNDTPLSGVAVDIREATEPAPRWYERTDDAGRFRARGLAPGAYEITVERRCLASGRLPFAVESGALKTDVGSIVTADPTQALKVRVVDASHEPIVSALILTDGVIVGRTDAEGRLTTHVGTTDLAEVTVNVQRGGTVVTVPAGRFAPGDTEHEIVLRYAGITLRLRDREAPESEINLAQARFVARCGDRETRGQRWIGGLLVIQQPNMKGSWRIDLDVDEYAPTSVTVDVDSDASAPPIDVWLLRRESR